MARTGRRSTRKSRVPQLVERASRQAYHALLDRARKLKLDFNGHVTGIKQDGNKIYLTVDKGVGCTRCYVVKRVKPLNAKDYLPSAPIIH